MDGLQLCLQQDVVGRCLQNNGNTIQKFKMIMEIQQPLYQLEMVLNLLKNGIIILILKIKIIKQQNIIYSLMIFRFQMNGKWIKQNNYLKMRIMEKYHNINRDMKSKKNKKKIYLKQLNKAQYQNINKDMKN